jgi:hypothetical protein
MFKDAALESYLEKNTTLKVESFVVAEWNMNEIDNISASGNYRYRPFDSQLSASVNRSASPQFQELVNQFDPLDDGGFYLGANESFTVKEYDNYGDPLIFRTPEINRGLYYDLKECFMPFRPRSGINKVLFFNNKLIDSVRSARRPRYYVASKNDQFKYWNSYRKENGEEFGVSITSNLIDLGNAGKYIEDVAPFVVYNKVIPANRIVVKMQTNLDEREGRLIRLKNDEVIVDRLADRDYSSIPKVWSIQYLDSSDNWINAIEFDENATRSDGSPIVSWNGYVEIYYGLKVPEDFKVSFNFKEYLNLESQLPAIANHGEAYIIGANKNNIGQLKIYDSTRDSNPWLTYTPDYGFSLIEDERIEVPDTKRIGLVSKLTNPDYFESQDGPTFREIVLIKGLRVVVKSMYGEDVPFELIELSPRIKADMTDYSVSFDFNKSIVQSNYGLPVGGIQVSNGKIELMNFDSSFSEQNIFNTDIFDFSDNRFKGSIIAERMESNIKFDFYEVVKEVPDLGIKYDKFIPLKSLYSEFFPKGIGGMENISVSLRDAFFRVETMMAPTIFLKTVPLTAAVAIMLDNVGFSNYVFKNFVDGSIFDPIIPYFFVEPDITVAEVLQRLAIATQSAMFFDEYNNLVIMPKEYMLPELNQRPTDIVLYGDTFGLENVQDPNRNILNDDYKLSNIISLKNEDTEIINDGQINYTTRYIQRSVSSLKQASYIDEDRTYVYKPVLLWEVAGEDNSKTINESSKQSGYALGAVALNASILDIPPYVENGELKENIIDVGENVYWLPRFQGYLYANGEIIKYDAQEFLVYGGVLEIQDFRLSNDEKQIVNKVWIQNNQQYQKYFGNLPFNGKIFPSGKLRIYADPYYEEINDRIVYKDGPVQKHGRGQFNTEITSHAAGLDDYWSSEENLSGCEMKSEYLLNTLAPITVSTRYGYTDTVYPQYLASSDKSYLPKINFESPKNSIVGKESESVSSRSTRNGIIANFGRENVPSDSVTRYKKTTDSGTIQSSALVFTGPTPIPENIVKTDYVSYVHKKLRSDFRHVGTRMRIIGRSETNDSFQTPLNSTEYFVVKDDVLSGGSGGIGVMVNENKNYGYFFEICSLSKDNLDSYVEKDSEGNLTKTLENLFFYKVVPGTVDGETTVSAIPVKLWGGLAQILVDEGIFVGQDRIMNIENPTVYDLAVEFKQIGSSLRFFLYINNRLAATVDDNDPLPFTDTVALFVRGSSKCMFENIYALNNLQSRESATTIIENVNKIFYSNEILSSQALTRYAMSGIIKGSYLSGIGIESGPKYNIYYDEFGTIMRECAYFNIKYDQAYPAFLAKLAPTINKEKTYTISGFQAGSYGAEFLIFNSTDKAIALDETSGNYLRVIGVVFTQSTSNVLTVDDFLKERSKSYKENVVDRTLYSAQRAQKVYQNVMNSRSRYGQKSFSLESVYIQKEDDAEQLMNWVIDKTLRPRKIITAELFGTPHLQLGDLVSINYTMPDGIKYVDENKQFIIKEINYSKENNLVSNNIVMVEV